MKNTPPSLAYVQFRPFSSPFVALIWARCRDSATTEITITNLQKAASERRLRVFLVSFNPFNETASVVCRLNVSLYPLYAGFSTSTVLILTF